jgi:anti-anti-sigma factor
LDATATVAERDLVARAGRLTIERGVDAPGVLLVSGEIDASSSDALATAVHAALATGDDVTVDFHNVLFCDLGGLRALVRAAATVSAGQSLRVAGLPRHLHRALQLVGWADLPGLVIDAYSEA